MSPIGMWLSLQRSFLKWLIFFLIMKVKSTHCGEQREQIITITSLPKGFILAHFLENFPVHANIFFKN